MPSLYEARLRHATHYANVLRDAEQQFNQEDVDHRAILHLFDESAPQIRIAQVWLAARIDAPDVDSLRMRYALEASGIIGIRYSLPDRIALGELGFAAARRTNNPLLQAFAVIDLANAYVFASDYDHSVALNRWCIDTLATTQEAAPETQLAWLSAVSSVIWLDTLSEKTSVHTFALYIQGKAVGNIANSQFARGELASAEATYYQQLAICRTSGDLRGMITALMNLGALYVSQADVQRVGQGTDIVRARYDQAVAACGEARSLAQTLGDRLTESRVMVILGMSLIGRGSAREAEGILLEATAILREYRDYEGECAVLDKLGSAYLEMQHYAEAEEHYAEALAIADREQFAIAQCEIHYHFGLLYQLQNRLGDATLPYRQALEIAEAIGHRVMESMIQYNLALIYEHHGKHQQAYVARTRYNELKEK